jgi:flavin-dependent dehydrogenase
VGDAGYTKDPVTAQGITNAFQSAQWCGDALHEVLTDCRDFDDAMRAYQEQRDTRALPLYKFTTQLATLEPPPLEMQQLLAAIAGNQEAMDDFVSVNAGTLSPESFFDPAKVETILASA